MPFERPNVPLQETVEALRRRGESGLLFHYGRLLEPAPTQASDMLTAFVSLFPIYQSYLAIAKGERPRFEEMLERLNAWLIDRSKSEGEEGKMKTQASAALDFAILAEGAAGARTKPMPSLRWRVFMRDQWRCVACGLKANDGAILHVDHIVPRSRGGLNDIDNLQTLCWECNVGKGNRDQTDLRA